MATFRDITAPEIRHDCRHYTGYRPCRRAETCVGCTRHEADGTRILIIKLGALGDVLRTTSLLPALRRTHSPCTITWMTRAGAMPLLANNPQIDQLMALRIEDVLGLEAVEHDLAINLDKDPEALGLMRRVRARRRMGFAPHEPTGKLTIANEASLHALRLGLDDELKFRLGDKTYPQIVAEMAEVEYRGEEYTLELAPGSPERAHARLEQMCESEGLDRGFVLGLNTGTGSAFPTKQWTAEGFADLARQFLARHPEALCLLLGGEAERDFNERVRELAASHRLLDGGCGNTMEEFFALVDACDAVVSSDSLGMHVAIARRVPTVALFGPTAAQEVDLFGRGEKIVTDFPCSPCYLKRCPLDVSCMQALHAGKVLGAVEKILMEYRSREHSGGRNVARP